MIVLDAKVVSIIMEQQKVVWDQHNGTFCPGQMAKDGETSAADWPLGLVVSQLVKYLSTGVRQHLILNWLLSAMTILSSAK